MKYAIWPGEEFYAKMLKSARLDSERAVVMLLWRTGMHSSTLTEQAFYFCPQDGTIEWKRPKTGKQLRAKITKPESRLLHRVMLARLLPTNGSTLRRWVRRIGDRAGYAEQAVSPLTFRHSRAVYLLDGDEVAGRKPMPFFRVAQRMGCSVQTLEGHYAVVEDDRGY